MLQSIQFNGSGPPTYVYAQKAVGTTMDFYQVFAAETEKRDARRQEGEWKAKFPRKELNMRPVNHEEVMAVDDRRTESLQEVYQKEYGRRESFLWRQR